jgi:uncharacterized membrane protein YfcA
MPFEFSFLWAAMIILLASFITSAFGFGFGLIVMPFLLFLFDVQTATPLAAGAGTILALFITIKLRRHIRLKSMWRLLISGLVGLPVGLAILVWVHNDILVTVLGGIIIISSVFQLTSPKTIILRYDRFSFFFGFFAGVLGVSYNIPAPPLIIYATLRKWNQEAFKATLQGLFIVLGILVNISHLSAGLWKIPLLKLLAVCIPFVVVGVIAGFWVSRFIKQEDFERYIHFVLIALGSIIIYRSMMF